jgi:hypothetical protein|tara:strand:- start:116 stop:670 length:555 start_codon:yes stop_codon:yes gene_type:complete
MAKKLTEELSRTILMEYCEGELQDDGSRLTISLDKLVTKYGVARATLFRRADKEDWSGQRTAFLAKARQNIQDNRIKDIVAEAGKLDRASLAIASGLLGRVANKLRQAQAEDQNGRDILSAEQIRALANTALTAQKIGKLALGEASEITKVNADVTVPDSFRQVMSELHAVRESRAERFSPTIQ